MQALADQMQKDDMLSSGSTRAGMDFWFDPDA